ncbi:pseudouridine synthase [Caldalkalibacillus mannanilyticus]|uniref:pseudouridine synthase n=1 Tax=Caldalkalibacillus mannanilyticus TaxID=1418 RepID=UPI00046808AD|nr:pseudouridine synthase [Caldalkalibacillus mannanilyticus]
MRLDKLLANMGFGSRKEMKKFLKSGQVTVNDQVVKDGKAQIDPQHDIIRVSGEQIEYKEFVYFMLHKPQGYLSATEDLRDKTVIDLLEPEDQIYEVFPVGRLDKDTEGLLILTNDGKLAHELLSPKKHVPKTYYAHIEGKVTEEDVAAFKQGVTLDDGYVTLPAHLSIIESAPVSKISLTIYEGKFHQVKRMFASRGKKVTYLKRTAMGALELDPSLKLGEYRELTDDEREKLKNREGVEMNESRGTADS